jgi:hypothetical protein
MRSPSRLLLAALVAAWVVPSSGAFTDPVRRDVLRRTASLMPPALQEQLEREGREVDRAATATPAGAITTSEAAADLEKAVRDAVALLDRQAPMAEVGSAFGRMARAAADLSFAPQVEPVSERDAAIKEPFARYVETMLPKITVTFGGYADPDLAAGDVAAFARRVAADAGRDKTGVLRAYFPEGRRAVAADFDERSVPFAAASLEISLAVTTTARIWLYAWHRARGDLSGTRHLPASAARDPFSPPPAAASPRMHSATEQETPR